MTMTQLQHWRLSRRSTHLTRDLFELVPTQLPDSLLPGEIRVRTICFSLDPYRARGMQTWAGEVPGWAEGVIHGRIVGEVIQSAAPEIAVGECVWGVGRWQAEEILRAEAITKIAPEINPPSLAIGLIGASGISAWVGLHLADPKPGETVLVTAATGPVGATAGQLAKRRGCRVIGVAGGAEKCAHAVANLGFEICLDHREPDLAARIAAAAPEGISILFENVGARMIDATLPSMVAGGRISMCGLAAHYNSDEPFVFENFKEFLYRQIVLTPFMTAGHRHLYPAAQAELLAGALDGSIHWDETVIDGLENAASAYLAMLEGTGTGKRLIRI